MLRLLLLEEEQCQIQFEAAHHQQRRLELAIEQTVDRGRAGRALVRSSLAANELTDRMAGLELERSAARQRERLAPCLAEATLFTEQQRELYLGKRVERMQAETLIAQAERQAQVESQRRAQSALDEWFLNRRTRLSILKESAGGAPQDPSVGKWNS